MEDRKPWSFCETPNEKCTMNYCDENGCINRKRSYSDLLPPTPTTEDGDRDVENVDKAHKN